MLYRLNFYVCWYFVFFRLSGLVAGHRHRQLRRGARSGFGINWMLVIFPRNLPLVILCYQRSPTRNNVHTAFLGDEMFDSMLRAESMVSDDVQRTTLPLSRFSKNTRELPLKLKDIRSSLHGQLLAVIPQ